MMAEQMTPEAFIQGLVDKILEGFELIQKAHQVIDIRIKTTDAIVGRIAHKLAALGMLDAEDANEFKRLIEEAQVQSSAVLMPEGVDEFIKMCKTWKEMNDGV